MKSTTKVKPARVDGVKPTSRRPAKTNTNKATRPEERSKRPEFLDKPPPERSNTYPRRPSVAPVATPRHRPPVRPSVPAPSGRDAFSAVFDIAASVLLRLDALELDAAAYASPTDATPSTSRNGGSTDSLEGNAQRVTPGASSHISPAGSDRISVISVNATPVVTARTASTTATVPKPYAHRVPAAGSPATVAVVAAALSAASALERVADSARLSHLDARALVADRRWSRLLAAITAHAAAAAAAAATAPLAATAAAASSAPAAAGTASPAAAAFVAAAAAAAAATAIPTSGAYSPSLPASYTVAVSTSSPVLYALPSAAAASPSSPPDSPIALASVVWAYAALGVSPPSDCLNRAVVAARHPAHQGPTPWRAKLSWALSKLRHGAADDVHEGMAVPWQVCVGWMPELRLDTLLAEVELRQDVIMLDGRPVPEARKTAWQSECGATFLYSGKEMQPAAGGLSPCVAAVRDALERQFGVHYDSVLINYYPDGKAGMRYHSDPLYGVWCDETSVVSLGDTRDFIFRETPQPVVEGAKKVEPVHFRYLVSNGDVVRMTPGCQALWQHCIKVEKEAAHAGPRVSLVYKKLLKTQAAA